MNNNEINMKDLKTYEKNFKLEAELLIGTLIGCKDNKISCIDTIKEGKNRYGEISKGIVDINGSGLWIDLNSFDNWIIKAIEL